MATEPTFSEANTLGGGVRQGMVTFKSNLSSATRGSNKRKRGNNDQGGRDSRISPMSKRTNANAFEQHPDEASGGAPTASMGDPHGDNLFAQQSTGGDDQSAQHFDLSALQAHSQSASAHGASVSSTMDTATAAAALSQHYSMQVPPHPDESFMNEPTPGTADQTYSSLGNEQDYHGPDADSDVSPDATSGKPTVGSDEWHKQRKENHKEVERRRRETINEGINELAKIVPNCEKNKGSILARAVHYITKLHEDASQNIDKWTFEKLVTEQALTDLSGKLQRAWAEKEAWKRVAKEAGVDVDNVDLGLEADEDEDVGDTADGLGKNIDGQRDDQLQRQRPEHRDNEA